MPPTAKRRCALGCRMLQVIDELWLCPHSAWGPAADMADVVAEARADLEAEGGYAAALARLEADEAARAEVQRLRAERKRTRAN
jgi:hypothetical protein